MNPRHFAGKRARILYRARSERHAKRALAHLARECGAQPIYRDGKLVAHQMPDGFIVCEKRRYRDEAAAMEELANVRAFAHLQDRRIPVRAYPCHWCGGWHTTSKVKSNYPQ